MLPIKATTTIILIALAMLFTVSACQREVNAEPKDFRELIAAAMSDDGNQ